MTAGDNRNRILRENVSTLAKRTTKKTTKRTTKRTTKTTTKTISKMITKWIAFAAAASMAVTLLSGCGSSEKEESTALKEIVDMAAEAKQNADAKNDDSPSIMLREIFYEDNQIFAWVDYVYDTETRENTGTLYTTSDTSVGKVVQYYTEDGKVSAIRMYDKNGTEYAYVNYTYGTDGEPETYEFIANGGDPMDSGNISEKTAVPICTLADIFTVTESETDYTVSETQYQDNGAIKACTFTEQGTSTTYMETYETATLNQIEKAKEKEQYVMSKSFQKYTIMNADGTEMGSTDGTTTNNEITELSYTYDPETMMDTSEDGTIKTRLRYDGSKMTTINETESNSVKTYTIYNPDSRVIGSVICEHSSTTYLYTYDDKGRESKCDVYTMNKNSQESDYGESVYQSMDFQYDGQGNATATTSDGETVEYTYNDKNQILSQKTTTDEFATMLESEYDENGNQITYIFTIDQGDAIQKTAHSYEYQKVILR